MLLLSCEKRHSPLAIRSYATTSTSNYNFDNSISTYVDEPSTYDDVSDAPDDIWRNVLATYVLRRPFLTWAVTNDGLVTDDGISTNGKLSTRHELATNDDGRSTTTSDGTNLDDGVTSNANDGSIT